MAGTCEGGDGRLLDSPSLAMNSHSAAIDVAVRAYCDGREEAWSAAGPCPCSTDPCWRRLCLCGVTDLLLAGGKGHDEATHRLARENRKLRPQNRGDARRISTLSTTSSKTRPAPDGSASRREHLD